MNPNTDLENRLDALGEALRSRPRLTDRVMDELRRSVAEGSTEQPQTLRRPSVLAPPAMPRCRRRLFAAAAGTLASIAAILLVAMTMFPSPRVGWADVTEAIHAKKWVHGTVAAAVAGSEDAAMWLSPEQEIWAFQLPGSSYFYNGRERTKYEWQAHSKTITKLPLGEDDAQKVLSMNALSQGRSAVGHWLFGTEKIVSHERREVTEGGKTWIEFQMTLWRGEMNQGTLRVDPETRLPVYLLFTSPKDAKQSSKWLFDYPAEGPSDIYALGVPRETKIDDRMPSNDALAVLRAIAKSRAAIGDFRLIVGQSSVYPSYVVRRKRDKWRVDSWQPQVAFDALPEASNEQGWGKWFGEQLEISKPTPLLVCDGKSVWEHSSSRHGVEAQWKLSQYVAPQDLMSGEDLRNLPGVPGVTFASLLFPDLSPKVGWGFEFDPNPADAPGCVLLKRSAQTTMPGDIVDHEWYYVCHMWYYVDPTKGYAVVRAESFNLPPDVPGKPEASPTRGTITMEDFRQSPQGFWYPTVVRNTMPVFADDNPQGGAIRQKTMVTRYYFDFDADMPDSLFTVDAVQTPPQ